MLRHPIRTGGKAAPILGCRIHQRASPASKPAMMPILIETVPCAACSIFFQASGKGQNHEQQDEAGHGHVRKEDVRLRVDRHPLQPELGEKLEIVSDGNGVSDPEHALRQPHAPRQGIVQRQCLGQWLDIRDIEPDDPAHRISQRQKYRHRADRGRAEFARKQRAANQEARTDDRRKRGHRRTPGLRPRERADR